MDRPTPDATVRDATAKDADDLGRVQSAAWRSSYGDVLPSETVAALEPESLARVWRDALVRPPSGAHRVLVALAGGEVVGFAAVAPGDEAPQVGEVAALVVAPGSQRAGHGSRLLNAAVERLRRNGFEVVVVWVLEGDEARTRFLTGAGFANDGARRTFETGDPGTRVNELRWVASLREPA